MSAPVDLTNANVVTFIKTDPLHVGFAAILAANPGQDAPLIAACNNVNGPGAGTVAGDPLAKASAFKLIAPTELSAMTNAQENEWAQMFPDPIDFGDPTTQQDINLLFANYATSLAAFQQLYTRPAGPFEVYFGKGNTANTTIIDNARNSNGGNQF